ncbi:hypothetical protein Ancab_022961 [Ancistrocladus abbreviatus]
MLTSESVPSSFTFACLVRGCAENFDVCGLGCTHGGLLIFGLGMDSICNSSLHKKSPACPPCARLVVALAYHSFSQAGDNNNELHFFRAMNREGLGSDWLASQIFAIFYEMSEKGLELDESMLIALLHACYHAGLVKEGKDIFSRRKHEFAIERRTEHYVHIVKLLGMVGKLKKAYILILTFLELVDAGI